MCTTYMPGAHKGQNKALDLLELVLIDDWELSYRYWELNLGPLQGEPVFLTTGVISPGPVLRFLEKGFHSKIEKRAYQYVILTDCSHLLN